VLDYGCDDRRRAESRADAGEAGSVDPISILDGLRSQSQNVINLDIL
jgi:hypothetical protein